MAHKPKSIDKDKPSKAARKAAPRTVNAKPETPAQPQQAKRVSLFDAHMKSLSVPVLDASLNVSLPISNSDALLGVDAELDALDKLYAETDDADRRLWIGDKISRLTDEHTALSSMQLHDAWDAYGPSQNIKDAANDLKSLANQLDQQAKALDIAATAITAISKFVNAL